MSLFQCQRCGCCDNTALASQGCDGFAVTFFDWTGIEERKGLKLCSACAPPKFKGGAGTGMGKWHGRFARTFLPRGMFRTNNEGNLAHVESGDTNYHSYALPTPPSEQLSGNSGPLIAPSDEETRAGSICQPNGLMFDAFGNPRTRHVRITMDGVHLICEPHEVEDNLEGVKDHTLTDVYLSEREREALPEFQGW